MTFTSPLFVFCFLPIVLAGYGLLPKARLFVLLVAGYVFYGWSRPWYALLLAGLTIINFAGGRVIAGAPEGSSRRSRALGAALVLSLGTLAFFKYFAALPPGLSFFTFAAISYPIALYLDIAPAATLSEFACAVSLFPLVIAGPIVRWESIASQVRARSRAETDIASGAALFILGFAKKVFLANGAARTADAVFSAGAPAMLDAWFGIAAFAFQIYFDFSGYSDMAVGLGRMLGFEFLQNFDAPYLAESITDFWRRWHISLSSMLRDWVYTPLLAVGRSRSPGFVIARNLLITMLVCGIWHGATWLFVLWGAFHGIAMVVESRRKRDGWYASLPRAVRVGSTFVLILISWVLFRAGTLPAAGRFYAAMLGLGARNGSTHALSAILYTPGALLLMSVCALLSFTRPQAGRWIERITWTRAAALIALFAFALVEMAVQAHRPFLYAKF